MGVSGVRRRRDPRAGAAAWRKHLRAALRAFVLHAQEDRQAVRTFLVEEELRAGSLAVLGVGGDRRAGQRARLANCLQSARKPSSRVPERGPRAPRLPPWQSEVDGQGGLSDSRYAIVQYTEHGDCAADGTPDAGPDRRYEGQRISRRLGTMLRMNRSAG